MKAFRKAAVIGMVVCMCATLFTGCPRLMTNKERDEQISWVEELNDTFKKDKFEYMGPKAGGYMEGPEKDIATAKSKKYPDQEIWVMNRDGKFQTNYNTVRYTEDMEEYIREIFEERFYCDSCEVEYLARETATPVENMDFDKYLRKYAHFNSVKVIMYQKNSAFTWEDQTVNELIKIAKQRNEACNITLYYCTEETDNPSRDSVCYYTLTMNKAREIKSITVASNGGKERKTLVENETW